MSTTSKDQSCDIVSGSCDTDLTTKNEIKNTNTKTDTIKITYYYDALCGWCYGFKNEFHQFVEKHPEIEFEIVNGGLFTGDRVGLINDVAPYIKQGAYKSVEEVSGVKFGEAFLEKLFGEGDVMLNSLPTAVAMCVVKENKPKEALKFANLLLTAVYRDGVNVEDVNVYERYLKEIDFDFDVFKAHAKEEKYLELVAKDYENFTQNKISGMPTLVVQEGVKRAFLSNGFAKANDLENRLQQFLSLELE